MVSELEYRESCLTHQLIDWCVLVMQWKYPEGMRAFEEGSIADFSGSSALSLACVYAHTCVYVERRESEGERRKISFHMLGTDQPNGKKLF